MKKKPTARKQIKELTPDVLNDLDQNTLVAMVMKLYEQNKALSEQLQVLIHEKYGRKTERNDDPNQMRLFAGETQPASEETSQSVPAEERPAKPRKPGHTRNPMPSHLECRPRRGQPTKDQLNCRCGLHRRKINEVLRKQRFECVPMTIYIEQLIDEIWQCPGCGDTVVVSPNVIEPVPDGKVGPRLLCRIVEDRWLKHLPLYRQEQAFARLGIDIDRSTMCGWSATIANIFRRVVEAMWEELLLSKIIAIDDTPVKVQDRQKKNNIKRGREWICLGDRAHPVNLFFYTEGRDRAGPLKRLAGFKGFLMGDCFSGNRAVCAESGATLVACRAHDRRYYKRAKPNNKKACNEMLDMYEQLFEIEATARDLKLSDEDVLLLRQQESVPILNQMKTWLDKEVLTALPSSSFGKAVGYSLNNWTDLNNYLLDGELRIDNNLAEQQMKVFATGRKNWYFFGSDEAGEIASIILSIFSTCLRNGVEPGAYLLDVLERLVRNPDCDVKELLPHRWKPKAKIGEMEGAPATPEMLLAV